jgi:acyl-CoA dehydrogenase
LTKLASEEQRKRWLPTFVTGETMFAIAMTEPGTGSDLAAMRTTAKLSEDGTQYVLNGAKTFITGGLNADRVIVCARTAPPKDDDRRHGLSLLVVDALAPGFSVGRKLDKIGLHVWDTVELTSLTSVCQLRTYLANRIKASTISAKICPGSDCQSRLMPMLRPTPQSGSRRVAEFQNTKFELAACQADVDAMEAVVDRALEAYDCDALSAADAASVKLFCTEAWPRVVDRCLQLHGGYVYINEYPIARLYADNRVNRIVGGTSEVMKTIIAKNMGL